MSNTRKNKGATVYDLSEYTGNKDQLQRGHDAYSDWHWGMAPEHVFEWSDPDYPDHLVECGRLSELRVRIPGQSRMTRISLADKEANKSHLCWDLDHPLQRLYICTSPAVRAEAKAKFWHPKGDVWNLNDLAAAVGSVQGKKADYPDISVKVVGVLTNVVYYTGKLEDWEADGGKGCFYIHKMGEEGGVQPALAVDSRGRFWIAGGSYTCPNPGITR